MNIRKRLKRDFERMEIPSKQAVLPHTTIEIAIPNSLRRRNGKRWMTAPMVIAMVMVLAIGVAAAGSIILSHLNANVLTGNNTRLTEVPEGYMGVYTIEDLMAINIALQEGTAATHYILMNDIVFSDTDFAPGGICENGWNGVVIGRNGHMKAYDITNSTYDDRTCFINGNGYAIKNLKIETDVTEAMKPHVYIRDNGSIDILRSPVHTKLLVGLFATHKAIHLQIINLGLENCEINVTGSDIQLFNGTSNMNKDLDVLIGGIAAAAEYIGGCYVNGLTVNTTLNVAPPVNHLEEILPDEESVNDYDIAIGSLAGYAQYVDACYAENTTLRFQSDSSKRCTASMGGLTGSSVSCLTSYFDGEIIGTGDGLKKLHSDAICPATTESLIPKLLTEAAYENLKAGIYARYGENSFDTKKILAYFVCKDLSSEMTETAKQNLTVTMERWNRIMGRYASNEEPYLHEKLYVFDPSTPFGAESALSDTIVSAFESEEEYIRFCAENNIKVGQLYCYTFEKDQTVTENDAIGFDFDTLWTIRDGRPKLKIFEN